jgi:hypothetical protein
MIAVLRQVSSRNAVEPRALDWPAGSFLTA